MKLWYFPVPGLGETTRIMLHYGGVAFEDVRFAREDWDQIKPKMPYGQAPVLELDDGSMLAQSSAIEHYVARMVKLLPDDSLAAAQCYEICGVLDDCNQLMTPTWAIQDLEERKAKRKSIAETTLHAKLKLLDQSLETKIALLQSTKEFFVAGALTYADIKAFVVMSIFSSGWMDGLDRSLLAKFPSLMAFHKRVASTPAIKAYYDTQTDDVRKAFKPDFFDGATLKLFYFALPGRAEVSRVMLNYGGVPFEDVRLTRDQWAEMKPKTPFGQVPVLQLEDGSMLAQSHSIDSFVARKVGLYPSSSLEVARCDEVVALVGDIFQAFNSTFGIQDLQERIAARKNIVEGPTQEKLGFLVAKLGGNDFFVGNKLSYADVVVFCSLSMMCSGWMDGLDTSLLANFPVLKAHHKRIASIPEIKAYYDKEDDDLRKAMKPDFLN